ncbi:SDR family oxidoreductase [Salmonella enterica subsp. enterica serovar Kokomlemle]
MTKVAIVTASDSGIGKACALLLAQNGFDIGITWHSDERGAQETAKKAAQFGVRVETIHLDLSQLPEGAQAIEHLIQRLGRIINITSVHEHTPLPQASAYTAAKHALGGLTKSMALELIEHHILVNAVALGAIATPMNDMDDSDIEPGSEPSIPIARPGSTHEIASLVAWLCSEGASYTTGQSLIVDGGFMLANPQFNAK